jgi:hypothetical protein
MTDDIFEDYRELETANVPGNLNDPRQIYARPIDLINDAGLSTTEKWTALRLWAAEIEDQLKAEAEGMSASDPMHHRDEAALADEAAKVGEALAMLEPESDKGAV